MSIEFQPRLSHSGTPALNHSAILSPANLFRAHVNWTFKFKSLIRRQKLSMPSSRQPVPSTDLFLVKLSFLPPRGGFKMGKWSQKKPAKQNPMHIWNRCSLPNVGPWSPPAGNLERRQVSPWQEQTSPASWLSWRGCCGIAWPFHLCIPETRDRAGENKGSDANLQSWEVKGTTDVCPALRDVVLATGRNHGSRIQSPPSPEERKLNSQSWCAVPLLGSLWSQLSRDAWHQPRKHLHVHQGKRPGAATPLRTSHLTAPVFSSSKAGTVAAKSCSAKLESSLAAQNPHLVQTVICKMDTQQGPIV